MTVSLMSKKKVIYTTVFASLFAMSTTVAAPLSTHQSRLQHVIQQIQTLQKKLHGEQIKKQQLKTNLKQTETQIGKLTKNLKKTNRQMARERKSLQHNWQKQHNVKQQLDLQQKLLIAQIRATYLFGQQLPIKILLNQQHPTDIERYLHYYQYFQQARLHTIENIKQLSKKLKTHEKNIYTHTHQLKKLIKQTNRQQRLLADKHYERQHLLNLTNKNIQTKSQRLRKLKKDKAQLTKMITRLRAQQAYQHAPGARFATMRGKLHWPISRGHLIQHFGKAILNSTLHTTGILISAKPGEAVHAIFPGQVIFANWLRGFGLLVIIKHGTDYLSLYGRNQSLYVASGQKVTTRQIIATAGNSDEFQETALYFEIRHHSTPINPIFWLTKA